MRRFPVVALAALVSACSVTPPEDSPRVAYREAESVRSLEVPPDLTRSSSPDALEISDPGTVEDGGVLPEFDDIRMVRSGPLQWLEIHDATPGELWSRMNGFLRSEGLTVRTQRPAEGLIETAWAERFDAVPRGGLGGLFQNLLGTVTSDDIRDKYQIRLERLDDGGTRIFLTHWAAQEINRNPNSADTPIIAMARAQPDPAIAAEMRRRLLMYLGVSRERARTIVADGQDESVYTTPVRLIVSDSGVAHVEIDDTSYRRALGLVGEGLRLMGAEVTATDDSRGTIQLRWVPPEEIRGSGLFSSDRPRELMVRLEPEEDVVRVVAADADGTVRSGELHVALLERLVDEMGGDTTSYRGVSEPESESDAGDRPREMQTP